MDTHGSNITARDRSMPTILGLAAAAMFVAAVVSVPTDASAQSNGLLTLISVQVEEPDSKPDVSYWWSKPTEPQWTSTDDNLQRQLDDRGIDVLTPGGDARISRIYRTPDLSVENAAALASVLDARRVLVGQVTYRTAKTRPTWGLRGVGGSVDVRLIDAMADEPKVLRRFQTSRRSFASNLGDATSQTRERLVESLAGMLGRTLEASSGPVGPTDLEEPTLRLHGVQHGLALEWLLAAVRRADTVEAAEVAWAAEGIIGVEINPSEVDERRAVDYAGRALVNHQFEGMTVHRRTDRPDIRDLVLDVTLSQDFEPNRSPRAE